MCSVVDAVAIGASPLKGFSRRLNNTGNSGSVLATAVRAWGGGNIVDNGCGVARAS